jgi:hypothetical protein
MSCPISSSSHNGQLPQGTGRVMQTNQDVLVTAVEARYTVTQSHRGVAVNQVRNLCGHQNHPLTNLSTGPSSPSQYE